jgi:glycosyltransferase involved in cell wall biosynthesis
MPKEITPSVCFILPEYNKNTDSHYNHTVQLISELSRYKKIFLYAESGQKPELPVNFSYNLEPRLHLPLKLIYRIYFFSLLRVNGCTIFYAHYADLSAIIAAVVTRILGGRTYKWHCAQEHYYSKPWGLTTIKDKLVRELPFKLSIKLIHGLVTCSPKMVNYYFNYYHVPKHKLFAIPNFICLKKFTKSKSSKKIWKKRLHLPAKPILLFVHRLAKRKGADRLIALAKVIKEKRLNQHILVIGGGPLENKLRKQIQYNHLSQYLTLVGPVPNNKILGFYHASDVLIMPSRVEEFGRVQLEAMATGLPIIATNTYGTKSVLTEIQQQLVVPQNQFQKIPLLAKKLLTNKNLHRQIVQTGYTTVKKYELSKIKKLYLELLFKL